MDKESGLQQKLITKYIALFEISVMALTIMWLLLASSAQNLYFGALVQTVTYLEDTVTWMVTGLLLVGMMTLAISPQQLVRATSSYLAGMFSTLMFILVGYLFLRVELFFVPAVSLWLNIAMVIFGLGMLLFFSIFAWLKKSMITYWSLALPMLLSIGGLFFWALQGNIAAMVSIWGVALYWALIAGVFNGALYFWVRPYRGLNQLRLVVLAISLFTTLWFAFQGLWQSIVLVSDPVWKIVMLSTLILAIAIGSFYAMVAGMRSLPEGEEILFWNQITHWPLLVWTLAITVLMVGSGMVTELLAQYTRTFLGLNGTLVQGTWTSFSVSIQGITNTMYVPFVVILVVLFWLVVSLLVGGKTKKSTAANL